MFTRKHVHLLAAALASTALCGGAYASTTKASFAVSVSIVSKCSIAASPKPSATCTTGSTTPTIALDNGIATVTF